MKVLDFIKKHNISIKAALLCLATVLCFTACGDRTPPAVDSATTGPVETVEANSPPTESFDLSADEAETIETTLPH